MAGVESAVGIALSHSSNRRVDFFLQVAPNVIIVIKPIRDCAKRFKLTESLGVQILLTVDEFFP